MKEEEFYFLYVYEFIQTTDIIPKIDTKTRNEWEYVLGLIHKKFFSNLEIKNVSEKYVVMTNDEFRKHFSWLMCFLREQDKNFLTKIEKMLSENHFWKYREILKFENGEYKLLPKKYIDMIIENQVDVIEHFAHISKNGNIAYTASPKKGLYDIQSVVTPGKYLTTYFSHVLTHDEIEKLASFFYLHNCELKFATTADEIEFVYRNGPATCMTHGNYISQKEHPVRMYAAGDLAVAYLETKDGDIISRVLCWPEKKIYLSKIYGNHRSAMITFMEETGYECDDEGFIGARLLKMEIEDMKFTDKLGKEISSSYICPFVDVYRAVKIEDDCLRIHSFKHKDHIVFTNNIFMDRGVACHHDFFIDGDGYVKERKNGSFHFDDYRKEYYLR